MERIIRILQNSGFRDFSVDGGYLVMEDPTCFLRSIEGFMDFAWVAITAMTGVLLFGWALSFIRGAPHGIADKLRNLTLVFGILSAVPFAVNAIWGDDLFNAACRRIRVPISELQRVLAAQEYQLKSASKDNLFEEFYIWDSSSGQEYMSEMFAAEIDWNSDWAVPAAGTAQQITGVQAIPASGRAGASSSGRLNPASVEGRRVYKIENILSGPELSAAQNVIRQYGLSVRGMGRAGDGHLGANRRCPNCASGRRGHLGTDLYFQGREPSPGTPVPVLYSGTVARVGQVYKNDPSLHMVVINNDNGTQSRMLYLRSNMRVGQRVNVGDIVGQSENLHPHYGSNTPHHIHYELRKDGRVIDPESLL